MYLDPGTGSLFIQALFALFAMFLAAFSRSRLWLQTLWARAVDGVSRIFRRRNP
jgi:hypothetical protein